MWRSAWLAVTLAAICPAAAAEDQLLVGAPFELDAPVPGTGGGPFLAPELAASDTGLLAIWDGSGLGSRLDPATLERLDPDGLPVLDAIAGQFGWQAASTGQTYLVVSSTGAWDEGDFYLAAQLLDAHSGEALGAPILVAPTGVGGMEGFAVAAVPGGDYLVAWGAADPETAEPALRAARIDGESGDLLDGAAGFAVAAPATWVGLVRAAADGDGWAIAWSEGTSLRVARVLTDGAVPVPGGVLVVTEPENLGEITLARTDVGFVTLWLGGVAPQRIVAGAIDAGCAVVQPPVVVHEFADSEVWAGRLRAELGDGAVWVSWFEEDGSGPADVLGARLALGELLAPSPPIPLCTGAEADGFRRAAPALAPVGGEVAVVWEDDRKQATHLYGTLLGDAGPADPCGRPVVEAPNDERSPRLAASPDGYLAAWLDDWDTENPWDGIMGARVTTDGGESEPLEAPLFAAAEKKVGLAGAAAAGGAFYALWAQRDSYDTEAVTFGAARIDPLTGEETARGELAGATFDFDSVNPPIAAVELGERLLVVYPDGRAIRAAFWTDPAAPEILEPPLYVAPEPADASGGYAFRGLRAAVSGTTLFLVWSESYSPDADPGKGGGGTMWSYDAKARRFDLSSDGAPEPLEGWFALPSAVWAGRYAVAALGEWFYVFYFVNDDGAGTGAINAVRFAVDPAAGADAAVELAPIEVAAFDYTISALAVAPVDGGLLIAAARLVEVPEEEHRVNELFGMAIDEGLEIAIEPTLIDGAPRSTRFAVASSGASALLVDEVERYGSSRLVGRTIAADLPAADAGTDDGAGATASAAAGCTCRAAGVEAGRGPLAALL